MDKTILRYEHNKEMLKFSLFDEDDERILYVSLNNTQLCCEGFGIELTTINQNMEDFVNSKIINIKHYSVVADYENIFNTGYAELNKKIYSDAFNNTFDNDGSTDFNNKYANFTRHYFISSYIIVVKTTKGTFIILAYNEHNGYYTHDINIEYDDINILDSI